MANTFNMYAPCSICGGDHIVLLSSGAVDTELNTLPSTEYPCDQCEDGTKLVGTVTIPQLDDILDQVNEIKEKVDEIKEVVGNL